MAVGVEAVPHFRSWFGKPQAAHHHLHHHHSPSLDGSSSAADVPLFPLKNRDGEENDGTSSKPSNRGRRLVQIWHQFRHVANPFFLSSLFAAIATIILCIASLVIHLDFNKNRRVNLGFTIAALFIAVLSTAWIILDCTVFKNHRLRMAEYHDENAHSVGVSQRKTALLKLRDIVFEVLFFANLVCLIYSIVNLGVESMQSIPSTGSADELQEIHYEVTTMTIVDAILVAAEACFCIVVALHTWWPIFRPVQSTLMVCAVLQFILATLVTLVNTDVASFGKHHARDYHKLGILHRYCPHLSGIVAATAFLAFGLCVATGERNRLNPVVTRLLHFYVMVSICSTILVFVYFCIALSLINIGMEDDSAFWDVILANPILAAILLVINIVSIVVGSKIQSHPSSSLLVDKFDIAALSPVQFDAYARLIDNYGGSFPGAPSGKNALNLMRAYTETKLDGMTCKVLRVYKPMDSLPSTTTTTAPPTTASTGKGHNSTGSNAGKHSLEGKRSLEKSIYASKNLKSYENVRAWQNLDKENSTLFDYDAEKLAPQKSSVSTLVETKLSKNQLKRLQKKANARDKSKLDSVRTSMMNKSWEDMEAERAFEQELLSTEALILITSIDSYDLTRNVSGKFGRVLCKLLGSESWLKFLCIRMGLMAFHWPFRQATFYCSPAKRPVARSAAILRAICEWNRKLPRSERFAVLLDPRYQYDNFDQAIQPSGWLPTPLPPSHIVDLRPYKGKSVTDYLKAIKYRNQAGTFLKAGGEVYESKDFTPDECSTVMDLWHKIADKRTAEGHTAVLVDPNEEMIRCLGSPENNAAGNRSILFLKVEGQAIASCVLFRLGDTITSDLQGLDHELARKYKAYFVMMQYTIDIALKEGISFVDFGPTTSKPKLDIGSKSVPLMGGMYASKKWLELAISVSAKRVDSG